MLAWPYSKAVSEPVCKDLDLTAPLRQLQEATRRLAAGDLSVRVGKAAAPRGDEVAALSSDFDAMAERIQALMTAQQRLLGDVSHELRAPLARLNVALELARLATHPDSAPPLDRVEVESQRLDALIGQVPYINRLESMSEPGQRVMFDLADMVGEMAADADFEARSRNSAVRVINGTPSTIKGMPDLVRSAVENVVSDARERKTGGTGLGLAITERAVRMHGGLVSASKAPGGGLMVEIRLPLG